MIAALLARGIGIEAGVWTVADAEFLVASGYGPQVRRVLVEPGEMQVGAAAADALALAEAIHQVLDRAGLTVERLQHGDGRVAWPLLTDAVQRGLPTRIGMEDTFQLPNGAIADDNGALVAAAVQLGAG